MPVIKTLFENNKRWASAKIAENPDFFTDLAVEQTPDYLWIGCADSRVPASHIVGLTAGDLFVHRNVANVVVHTDLNCLSVIQYAVDVLQVKHIVVCGHYGCGGVKAAVANAKHGLIDNWLRHIRDVWHDHKATMAQFDKEEQIHRMCELNVVHQVLNVSLTTVVQDAWLRGQPLSVHGWIYSLADGLLRDLGMRIEADDEIGPKYEAAVKRVLGS